MHREESEKGLAFGSIEGKMAVVDEEGVGAGLLTFRDLFEGTTGSQEPVSGGAGVGADDQIGPAAKLDENVEAAGLAGLGGRGMDVEVGGGEEGIIAPGVEAPE